MVLRFLSGLWVGGWGIGVGFPVWFVGGGGACSAGFPVWFVVGRGGGCGVGFPVQSVLLQKERTYIYIRAQWNNCNYVQFSL